ncbi:hypothetical protein llap_4657 [Limosa lapponica baueri]|uniref:Uncharacterized protein n=1 Tax=Limosa lapponica baueri TaxID=1758121 RepID=A0A2I0UG78_LIMLA|nr:hypothetical protein llap_4657 [Limosa lapponica baueri]
MQYRVAFSCYSSLEEMVQFGSEIRRKLLAFIIPLIASDYPVVPTAVNYMASEVLQVVLTAWHKNRLYKKNTDQIGPSLMVQADILGKFSSLFNLAFHQGIPADQRDVDLEEWAKMLYGNSSIYPLERFNTVETEKIYVDKLDKNAVFYLNYLPLEDVFVKPWEQKMNK